MDKLKLIAHIFLLLIMFCMVFYNWFYARGVAKTRQQLGIALPARLEGLFFVNIILSFCSAIMIALFLLRGSF